MGVVMPRRVTTFEASLRVGTGGAAPRYSHRVWARSGLLALRPSLSGPCDGSRDRGHGAWHGRRSSNVASIAKVGLTTRCSGLASLAAELGIVRPRATSAGPSAPKSRRPPSRSLPSFVCCRRTAPGIWVTSVGGRAHCALDGDILVRRNAELRGSVLPQRVAAGAVALLRLLGIGPLAAAWYRPSESPILVGRVLQSASRRVRAQHLLRGRSAYLRRCCRVGLRWHRRGLRLGSIDALGRGHLTAESKWVGPPLVPTARPRI